MNVAQATVYISEGVTNITAVSTAGDGEQGQGVEHANRKRFVSDG